MPCNLSEETGSERIQDRDGQTENERDTFCLEMTRLHCNLSEETGSERIQDRDRRTDGEREGYILLGNDTFALQFERGDSE